MKIMTICLNLPKLPCQLNFVEGEYWLHCTLSIMSKVKTWWHKISINLKIFYWPCSFYVGHNNRGLKLHPSQTKRTWWIYIGYALQRTALGLCYNNCMYFGGQTYLRLQLSYQHIYCSSHECEQQIQSGVAITRIYITWYYISFSMTSAEFNPELKFRKYTP